MKVLVKKKEFTAPGYLEYLLHPETPEDFQFLDDLDKHTVLPQTKEGNCTIVRIWHRGTPEKLA